MSAVLAKKSLREQLAPLAAKLRSTRALVQPVSQVAFSLKPAKGQDPFSATVAHVLKWMDNRAGRRLPDAAWQQQSFELLEVGAQRTAAVALAEPRYWAARLDDADKKVPLRTWVTEIGVGIAPNGEVLFGTRLICATRGEAEPFTRSVPGFVKAVAKLGPAILDGVPLEIERVPLVADEDDVDELLRLLELPTRRVPVVVLALPEASTDPRQTAVDANTLLQRTLGAAHVRIITCPASFLLTDRVGKELSVFRQAVRTYKPGFSRWRDQPAQHPLALPDRIAAWPEGGSHGFEQWLIDHTLADSLRRVDREEELPSFNAVRQIAAQQERERLRESGGTMVDLMKLYEDDNDQLRKELEEQEQEYRGLLEAAEREREEALQVAQESKAQTFGLRRRIEVLERQLEQGRASEAPVELPTDLTVLEPWCQENLAGAVVLHNRALQGAKKSVYQDPSLIYKALLLLRDHYVPMRREGGRERKAAFEAAATNLGVENSLVGEAVERYPEQYTVQYCGRPRQMDWHLKKGDARAETRCFRLYYFWDDESQSVVVGWLPSHLKNALT